MPVATHVMIAQIRSVQRKPTLFSRAFSMNGNTKPAYSAR